MLKDIEIRSVANDAAYTRGCKYYENGAVGPISKTDLDILSYRAAVHGSESYEVSAVLSKNGDYVDEYACDCPAAMLYSGACKHIVALLKAIQNLQSENVASDQRLGEGGRLFSFFSDAILDKGAERQPLTLIPKLCVSREYSNTTCWLEFHIGREKEYVVRNIRALITCMTGSGELAFGKALTIDSKLDNFAEGTSQKVWELLRMAYDDESSIASYSAYFRSSYGTQTSIFEQKRFKLSPSNLQKFFGIMGEQKFVLVLNEIQERKVSIAKGRPPIALQVDDHALSGRIALQAEGLVVLDASYHYFLMNDRIYEVDEEFSQYAKPLIQSFQNSKYLKIEPNRMGDFFSTVMPEIEKIANVKVAPSFLNRFEIMPLTASVYFDYFGDGIAAKTIFRYDDIAFNPIIEAPPEKNKSEKLLIRDAITERQILRFFKQYAFREEKDQLVQDDEDRSYDFLTEALPQLTEIADVYYSESFRRRPVQQMAKVTAGVSVNDENMLEVSLENQDFNMNELLEILSSYRLKRRYHRLKDGTFISLEEQQLGGLADFVENAGIKGDNSNVVELPLGKAVYIDTLAREEDGLRLERNKAFKDVVRDLKNPVDSDIPVPKELVRVLRDYQVTGFCWLSTLAHYGLGGILADDMGLGKTLQVLTFLLSQQKDGAAPSLVVAPTSLMYNWLDEVQTFVPSLKAVVVAGTKQERREILETTKQVDLVITTYNMLKRDIDIYEQHHFRYCFLDEAQHIKNPSTQNAKAVKRLKTSGYFALTGTPIENTLTELWSIFDFLMPGYLSSHKDFKQRFETPIVRAKDKHALIDLNRHIAPFILRRMKTDVLKELPDKVEGKMLNEMTAKQAKVYLSYLVQAKKEFKQELAAHGFARSHIKILAILTRLRQICCHPSLFIENYTGGSGKLDMLEEVVADAREAGHRMLIFSQFTTMLHLIGDKLKNMGISYKYLDGQTPAMERVQLVKEFNVGDQPVFLISLKAGGTGLNLTGADMVIHYDPWWNPAVEDQATDRAYRLGQKKNVQVLKFITKDTIEEKIFQLQQKKKALIDQMIQPGGNFLSKLSEDEIRNLFM